MRKITLPLLGFLSVGASILPATAQQIDNTLILPDAKPGECYTKVITPPVFEITTDEVVIQEASERIETVEAVYNTVEKKLVIKESTEGLTVTDAEFETKVDRLAVRPAEKRWTSTVGDKATPASPDAVDQIARSGIDLDAVATGSCFTEYFVDSEYETRTRQVLLKEATEKITIVPAVYKTVKERVEIKEASTEVVDVPAVYRTESESVLVEPSRNVWQHCGLVERTDTTAGEIMCLVKVPERYETLTKTVLDKPATTKTITIPAVYRTIDVQKLVTPAKEVREDVPAEYQTVSRRVKVSDPEFFWLASDAEPDANAQPTGRVICLEDNPAEYVSVESQVVVKTASVASAVIPPVYETLAAQELVSAASERRIVIPARTRTVTSRVETSPGQLEWRQVLCEVDMTPSMIVSVQRALLREGFNPGPIDGIVGRATLDAMERYQSEKGLGRGGITYESLEQLEIKTASR
ncbi:MAG: peptidoglycan-binding domain-containing protein [Granulosicoccus sp.]